MTAPRGLYTPVYASLPKHPKTVAAAAALGISRHQLIGHLVCLWTWCLDSISAENSEISAKIVAIASEWPERKSVQFAEALADAGFLSRGGGDRFQIHEWDEYGGKVAAKQRSDRSRKRGNSTEIPRKFRGDSGVDETRRDETRRDEIIRSNEEPPDNPPVMLPYVLPPPAPDAHAPAGNAPRERRAVLGALTALHDSVHVGGGMPPQRERDIEAWAHWLTLADIERAKGISDAKPWSYLSSVLGNFAAQRRAGHEPRAYEDDEPRGGAPGLAAGAHAGASRARAMAPPGRRAVVPDRQPDILSEAEVERQLAKLRAPDGGFLEVGG